MRLRRRLVLTMSLALVAASAVAIGAPPASGGGSGDNILRYGVEAEADGLNPTANRFAAAGYMMANAVYDPLFRLGKDREFHPWLAESATPNEDFTTWDIKLRSDVTFHDGTPLTSEALVVNLQEQLADPLISLAINDFFDPDNPIEVVDELTARYNMAGPNAHIEQYFVSQIGYIASPTYIEAAKANPDLNQEPVGTGPFVFESRTQDSSTTFVRNDDYWAGDVKLDGIEFVIQTDPARRADQLLADELDMMHTSDFGTIDLLRGEDVQTIEQGTAEEGFALINTQAPPFDDVRARKALALATPRKNYLQIIGKGVAEPADSMFHPSSPFSNPDVKQEADKPAAAKKLAAEYCADVPENCEGDKIKFTFKYTGPSEILELTADVLIDGWDAAFVVERAQELQDDYVLHVATGDYQVVAWRQFGADDPDGDFTWIDCRNAGEPGSLSITWSRFCNEEIQALGQEQRASAEQSVQVENWQTISEILNEEYVYIFLSHTIWQIAASNDVKNPVFTKLADGGRSVLGNGVHSVWQISLKG
ncbi:MAG: ABC transporter substrate-binding protein [Actinobacteria bacterium]|nr:ABC transporter substrate-binding protein [Actinomycetota bacterium]